jgi:hypothetical protein
MALADSKFVQWIETNAVAYRSQWTGHLKPPDVVLRRIFREVDLTDPGGSPVGSFDGVDMAQKLFIENKAARGTAKINPATGKPYNPNAIRDFVQKQVVDKTSAKVAKGVGTLTVENPGWAFTAEFGANILLPPLPRLQGDDDQRTGP